MDCSTSLEEASDGSTSMLFESPLSLFVLLEVVDLVVVNDGKSSPLSVVWIRLLITVVD